MATLATLPNGYLALQSDTVYWLPVQDTDVNGNIVPAPANDVVTAIPSGTFAASLAVAVGVMPPGAPDAGAPGISLTPMVRESDAGNGGGGIGLTLTDTSGLAENSTTSSALFDIVAPPPGPAAQEGVDFPGVFTVSQPVPTATGP